MTTIAKKNQILENLDSLNQNQADDVLKYIKNLVTSRDEVSYKNFKREALKEIRQALRKNRKLNLSF
jgi:response regulator of citrate/malate metabolism